MVMIRVSTAALKARLGTYLAKVQSGETVEVTSHRHVVARIVAAAGDLEDLIAAPTRPASDLREIQGLHPTKRPEARRRSWEGKETAKHTKYTKGN